MNLGITGHQEVPAAAIDLIADQLGEMLKTHTSILGITSLAAGADQIAARFLLDLGGRISVVVPCARYEEAFPEAADKLAFRDLLARATQVVELPYPAPSEACYLAAGLIVAERSDEILAVWDGEPAAGLGGTADVVAYGRAIGKPIRVVWPQGADRPR